MKKERKLFLKICLDDEKWLDGSICVINFAEMIFMNHTTTIKEVRG
jgi:hypothetical protein